MGLAAASRRFPPTQENTMSVTVDHGDEIPLRCHRIEVRIRKLS